MIKAVQLAEFAEKHGWIVIDKEEGDRKVTNNKNFIRFLTPQGHAVLVEFYEDGSIRKIIT